MPERGREGQQAERQALVADLVRTQAVLQARTDQLRRIFASRWYRLARLAWRVRRGRVLSRAEPPRLADEGSSARPLDEATAALDRDAAAAGDPPVPGLEGAGGRPRSSLDGLPRLLFAGHSLSFCEPLMRRARDRGAAVREDRWSTHGDHRPESSAAALEWADAVHCEWCLGNAVWYSRNKRPGQRLVVRFHRMELETRYPGELDLERIDVIAFVARHVLEQACERFGWDRGDPRFHLIPNGIDSAPLDQPKLPGAQFTLAAIGYVPRLKRLDRALDVLELLRRHDERYQLVLKGREPWEHTWMTGRKEEHGYYAGLHDRLEQSPGLRGAVSFDPHGPDVGDFLRRAGWVLSTSEVEGHSVSLAEAMASGAVPVVLSRPGAAEQYEAAWIHADAEAAARAVLHTQEGGEHEAQAELARSLAARWDWDLLWPEWERLLLGDEEGARADRHVRVQPLHH